jgi:hypothetical protein
MEKPTIDAAAARLTTLTRVGFAARGLLYFVIGFLVIQTGRAEDPSGALGYVAQGGGRWLLGLMGAGLVAYGIWRLADAALDVERRGTDGKALAQRVAAGASGLIHLGLAWQAFGLMRGAVADHQNTAGEGAGAALQLPGGSILLVLTGAVLVGVGFYQLLKAATGGFLRHLEPQIAGRAWVKLSGRAGYAARGLIFAIVGGFVLNAGIEERSDEAGGMADALAWLASPWDLVIAVGLIGFGIFSLVEARYRIIRGVGEAMPQRR